MLSLTKLGFLAQLSSFGIGTCILYQFPQNPTCLQVCKDIRCTSSPIWQNRQCQWHAKDQLNAIADQIDFFDGLAALFGKGTHIDVDFDEHVEHGMVFEVNLKTRSTMVWIVEPAKAP